MLPNNLKQLKQMLRYKRPHGSATEQEFIEDFLLPLDMQQDKFGNLSKKIGDSLVIWSSHIDTVHSEDGFQRVVHDQEFGTFRLPYKSASNCLGADCTTGVWLMVQMINAGVEGLYIFHRGEECGGLGSSWIAKNRREEISQYKSAIAFDRFGVDSVVTHQGSRCCSDDFAYSLALLLNGNFHPDNTGLYTDTAEYTSLVPECTNISVGYGGHHTKHEVQNLAHLINLLNKLLEIDTSNLVISRDPTYVDSIDYGWGNVTQLPRTVDYDFSSRRGQLINLVRDYPDAVADVLSAYGVSVDDLCQEIYDHTGEYVDR